MGQAHDDYLNWVRQIQTVETHENKFVEVVQDLYVDSEGRGNSPLGIPEEGALFQLWTINSVNNESWLLDTAVVGASRPKAILSIEALDSYAGIPRTRADIPFKVVADYRDLQAPGEGIPIELTQVRSLHYVDDGSSESKDFPVISDTIISDNGVSTLPGLYTSISPTGEQPAYKVSGVEHFVVDTFSDSRGSRDSRDSRESDADDSIARAKIEVFPLTTGTMSELAQDQFIRSLPEKITMNVEDAYPGSEIILQATVTTPAANSSDAAQVKTVVLLHRNISNESHETLELTFSEFGLLPVAHGDMVDFSLISNSVFDSIILDEQSGTIDYNIKVNAGIHTVE